MSAVSYYTAEGLKKLREELDYLKSVARPKASQDIADARDKGDLSENAEYEAARQHIEQAGLGSYVEIREGDARETLRALDGPIDFVLIDGFPDLALEVLQLLTPKLRCGAIVVADNLGTFKSALAGYAAHVRDPANRFTSLTLPWKGGTEFSIRQ
eukprot:gene67753-92814_t